MPAKRSRTKYINTGCKKLYAMNERELKSLFCSSLRANHVKNNTLIPTSEIRIVQEAHCRSFDLLIAAVTKEPDRHDFGNYDNMLVRTQLLKHFALHEKCRIDCIRFYPVEVKSDDDVLDERLPNQIIDAILAFGLSILVLDKNHSKLARGLGKFLPTTLICYTGIDDRFEVVSRFDRLISSGVLNLKKTILAKALEGNSTSPGSKAYTRLVALERILQKIIFNQIYFENLGMTEPELEFLQMITDIRPPLLERKKLSKLIKETANTKMTDYL
ncbi:MAG TPA: hypothetical protein VKA33_03360 [Nitrososphaera sp.]|jgi:hypothetical protein|nr:hypothetical protein [Nitrososphaera sp.]